MNRTLKSALNSSLAALFALLLFGATGLFAQDKVNVPLTDPTRPAIVKVNLLAGSITVKAYEGKDVQVEARARYERTRDRENSGMKRVPMTSTGLTVEEENNKVFIGADSMNRPVDITVNVPVKTSLILRTVNDGDITVNGVDGELDVNNVNGEVTLSNVSGSAVAHALNGKVLVTFARVTAGKPMSFSSLNGDIDVTFPADLKANVALQSDQGDVLSDFDIQITQTAPKQVTEDTRAHGGHYRVKVDKSVRGTINGGGPEYTFKNFNGNILIRKAKTAAQ